MATPLTRQDLQAITDGANNRLIQRLPTRQDLQSISEGVRDRILNTINAFHVESQALVRQGTTQHDQLNRRLVNLESQIMTARQEIRILTQTINKLYDIQAEQVLRMRAVMPSQQSETF